MLSPCLFLFGMHATLRERTHAPSLVHINPIPRNPARLPPTRTHTASGVYTQAAHGVKMEAGFFTVSNADRSSVSVSNLAGNRITPVNRWARGGRKGDEFMVG